MRREISGKLSRRFSGFRPIGRAGVPVLKPRSACFEKLEERLQFSGVSTAFVDGTLTVYVSAADHMTITENVALGKNDITGPYTFKVTNAYGSVGGSGGGAFKDVKNITVDVTASGAHISVQGIDDNGQNQATGIPGNFTVADTQPNNKLSVEVHDGFTVGGAVSISNTGKGSTFVSQTIREGASEGQVETGVFLDPNRKGSYGSLTITGAGPTGVDGVIVKGNLDVNLESPTSLFVAGAEWVYRQDPDSPPWTTFRQDNNTVGGNLIVNGGNHTSIYSAIIGGNVDINEVSNSSGQDYALLGGVSIGGGLTIDTAAKRNGAFADFSTIAGPTSIDEGNGENVISTDSTFFGGTTSFSQGQTQNGNFIFIDSVDDLLAADTTINSSYLPDDLMYFKALQAVGLEPAESGSTFIGTVTSIQGNGPHQLDIAQDSTPVTVFTSTKSKFQAGTGKTIAEASGAHGVPIQILGYGKLTVTGF